MLRTLKPQIIVLAKAKNNLAEQLTPVNLERVCMQTDQSVPEASVRQSPLVEVWEAEVPLLL
jgi:hypothetical protein